MNKPEKKTKVYYDYMECRDYLQAKFGYNERDFDRKYSRDSSGRATVDDAKEYKDFWHWVVAHHEISNGCFIEFNWETLEEMDAGWEKDIYAKYVDEFADEDGRLEMYCWW